MFKSARWRSEKNKFKVVFKLQFHASQVPNVVGDGLVISVVPGDTGKPTVKSDKAIVRDGSCLWENPVYETVKFNQDPKSGKIHERIYYFIVGTGASKSGVLGEASIDFSSYAEATKVSLVSLPLNNSKTEAVLHVSIQRIHDSIDQRDAEESENTKSNAKDNISRSSSIEDVSLNKAIVPHVAAELNGTRRESSIGSDITMSSSESSSGIETAWNMGNSNSALEASTYDFSSTPRQNSDENLKTELIALSRQAEMSELELQTLRKQIVKESKRGQDLWREVVSLKEERDVLKGEIGKLKSEAQKTILPFEGVDSRKIIEELRQELNHANEINANLRIQLQKTQESNSELILAVKDLDEMLGEKNNREIREVGPTCQSDDDDDDEEQKALEELVKDHGESKEAYLLEQQIIDMRGEIEIYKKDRDELETQMEQLALDYEILKQENHEISYKLEQSQIQEQLKMQYECSSGYDSVQELESHIENLENESEKLEARVKSLEEELEKQAQGFEADLEALTLAKIEQEKRAIKAEEALRKTRWKNANTAERIQEEFKRLSVQMSSTFEANEKLATKALNEANELRLEKLHYESRVREMQEEIEMYVAKNKILEDEIESKKGLVHEVERLKLSVKEMELLVEQGNDERNEVEKELGKMRCVVNEKESIVGNLRKQVVQLRSELKKKEDALGCLEKKVKDRGINGDVAKGGLKTSKNVARGVKDVASLRERIKLLEGQIKAKETALETSANTFIEKEKDLYSKIEELESSLQLLNQSSARFCENEVEKALKDASISTGDLVELINEMAVLKETNKSMEREFNEMQERYSDISLKFAEVEGERQQLVMKLRNLKNANKSP